MAIFALIPQPNANDVSLPAAIKEHFTNDCHPLEGGAWLIAAKSAAKEISDRLRITDGIGGSAVVLEVASYFGRANPNVWTWIKNHWDNG